MAEGLGCRMWDLGSGLHLKELKENRLSYSNHPWATKKFENP